MTITDQFLEYTLKYPSLKLKNALGDRAFLSAAPQLNEQSTPSHPSWEQFFVFNLLKRIVLD